MFFADHYRRDWFNLWDERWYGGFSVTTYPPLTHQLTALVSFVTGVEVAYQLMSVISAMFLTYSVYLYSRIFLSNEEAQYAALVTAFLPAVGVTLNGFGQLPTVFSTAIVLMSAKSYHEYLSTCSRLSLIKVILWTVVAGLAHHLSFFLFLPVAFIPVTVKHFRSMRFRVFRLSLIYITISLVILLVIIFPFITYTLTSVSMVEIPHGSRENIFTNPALSAIFFWSMYGYTVFLLPNMLAIAVRKREMFPHFIIFILLFLYGLGGTTPLPKITLGPLWHILTYDRFAFWAAITYAPFLGLMIKDADIFVKKYYIGERKAQSHPKIKLLTVALLLGGLITCYAISSGMIVAFQLQPTQQLDEQQIEEIVTFLDKNNQWMYATLGLANQRILLSIKTIAPYIDGGYNQAKTLDILRMSGVESIDGAKYFPNGLSFLKEVILEGANNGLRYIVSADDYYDPILRENGLRPLFTLEGAKRVTVWEIPYATLSKQKPVQFHHPISVILWSLGPVTLMAATLFVEVLCRRVDKT
ncbi:MAG: 6-pyruvoyl-tetrahydropterin synthase-related protein [Candidatus Korarchaeota archaeon]|nr:6-pyruvoyl-tetrahydropterin synthase-related protein [Thermoproteota archaeon]